MDEIRKLRFIRDYNEALSRALKKEENKALKRKLESMFYEKIGDELKRKKEKFKNFPGKKKMLLDKIYLKKKKEHCPIETTQFLALLSRDDDIKFLIHDWDESRGRFDYERFMSIVLDKFLNKIESYTNVPTSLLMKLFVFLFEEDIENGWGFQGVKFGWSSNELYAWCKKKPGIYPSQMELPPEKREYKVQGKPSTYFYFQDLIDKFKSEIRFVNAGNQFEKFIRRKSREFQLNELKIEFDSSLKGLDFYIDVDKFASGLKKIFSGVKERKEFPHVKLSANRKEDRIEFRILHLESTITRQKPIEPKVNKENLGGDFKSAYDNFYGICDWSFEGPFQDGNSYKINYLKSPGEKDVEPSTLTEGIQHTLTFYYPKKS